jgi:hypothetical protein
MHPALQRLVEADTALEDAKRAVELAAEQRRQAALGLADIEDDDQRWDAALFAYREFGQGLSFALAEAATGLPGKKAQTKFLVRAGRMPQHLRGRRTDAEARVYEPRVEWPELSQLERGVIEAHIANGKPYWLHKGIGWESVDVDLQPDQARAYLEDPVGVIAARVGLTREEFHDWMSSEGSVRCSEITTQGRACKCLVRGLSSHLPLDRWKEAKDRGGYCSAHGG